MTRKEIKEIVIKCIKEIQELNGFPPTKIDDDTRPIGDLEEFDSLILVELGVRLSAIIGIELEDEIFFDEPNTPEGRKSSLTIRDIIENIYQKMIS